jgi:hypothetical protein
MISSVVRQYRRLPDTEPENDAKRRAAGLLHGPAPGPEAAHAVLTVIPSPLIAACAAASLAIGTRGAEHET